jgi:hypothetical protein
MKKAFLLITLLALVAGVSFGQSMNFTYDAPFPDTSSFKIPGGVINGGVAVAPDGRIWIQTYGGATDTLSLSPDTTLSGAIYVFNPDGSQASFSPMLTLSGVDETGASITDTLDGSGYGLSVDPSTGNILSVKWSTRLWLIDYKTGAGIRRIQNPITGYTSSLAGVAANSMGEIFLGPVLPGGAVQILNPDFTAGTQVAASVGDYGRTIAVSADGNDVYVPRFTSLKTYVFHSDNGSLGPYALTDSIFLGGSVETIAIHPVTGYVWAAPDRRSDSTWTSTANTYYAYDPGTKSIVDSFKTDMAYSPTAAYPRGTAFSPTGDTVYVGHFDSPTDPAVSRFVKGSLLSVQRIDDAVPAGFALEQNFPNPFNPSTEIRFAIGQAGFTTVRVYDMLGREVAQLVNQELEAGTFTATFNASNLPSGTYVYEVVSGGVRLTKKMMLLK